MIITLPVKEWLPLQKGTLAGQPILSVLKMTCNGQFNECVHHGLIPTCPPPPPPQAVKNHLGFKLGTLASFLLYFILSSLFGSFVGLAYQGKDLVFRFIIEYSSLMDFGPYPIRLFFYVRIFER
jgi:hypothetical protein